MTLTAAVAAQERMRRPCIYCGRSMRPAHISTHEPACSPEARERKRVRWLLYARSVRQRPTYVRRPDPTDACPLCGVEKNVTSAMCRPCRTAQPKPRTPLADRFWRYVDRRGSDECWPWIGARDARGYGRVNLGDNHIGSAHRIALELTVGPLAVGNEACHHCDNPPCCNPAHLFSGTHRENMRDASRKGRLKRKAA